jgi:hypothetical protein
LTIDLSDFHQLVKDTAKAGEDKDVVKSCSTEEDFTGLSVDFLIEAGSYVCIAASLYPSGKIGWTRDEAIIGGHFVRLFKLISAVLDQTCQHRRETTFILGRSAFETIVNAKFLMRFGSKNLFNSYVTYSLQFEQKLLALIERNVASRGGIELPIEQRMKRSIQRMINVSQISPELMQTKIKNWGNKNLFERSKEVGLDGAYLGVFGGGSHAIHGNWADLLEYHLVQEQDFFRPDLEWQIPRPQVLTTIALLSNELVMEYFCKIVGNDQASEVEKPLLDFYQRLIFAISMHEDWLSKK